MIISRLTRNIIYSLCGQILIVLLGFVSVKYIFGRLGADALGIIYFTITFNNLLGRVLDLGICSTTVREVAAHIDSEPDYVHDLIRTASLFYWGAFFLLGLAIYALSPFLVQKWINLDEMDAGTAIYVLRFLGIASLVALQQSFYMSIFRGLQRMEFNNVIDVVINIVRQFGTILILIMGGSLIQVVYWISASYGLSVFLYLIVLLRFFPLKALAPGYSLSVIKRNRKFASIMTLQTILGGIISQIDKIILSKVMPIGMFGYYTFAYGNVSRGMLIADAISLAAYPSFSALYQAGDRKALLTQYRKLQDLLCFSTGPIFALIPFALVPLFSFMLNHEAAKLLLVPTTLLCLGFYLHGALRIQHNFAVASGKPGIAVKTNLLAVLTVTPMSIVLIYYFGMTGAALYWILYNVFNAIYAIPKISKECINIRAQEWYIQVSKSLLLIGSVYGIAWLSLTIINDYSIISLTVAYLIATAIFLAASYKMMNPELRGQLITTSKSLGKKMWRLYK